MGAHLFNIQSILFHFHIFLCDFFRIIQIRLNTGKL